LAAGARTNNNLADFLLLIESAHTHFADRFVRIAEFQRDQFAAPQFEVSKRSVAQITVTRIGDVSTAATVDYFTSDGTASERGDIQQRLAHQVCARRDPEADVLITNDNIDEGNETVFLGLLNATATAVGPRNSATLIIHNGPILPLRTCGAR
jgi:hypothetical protein